MSTRANVIITDGYSKLYFYRHSDGYPEGTMPSLKKFLSYVKSGKIRNNVSQSAGWLIIIGAEEYKGHHLEGDAWLELSEEQEKEYQNKIPTVPKDWKVGAYEPTSGIHGDIEYLYVIDLTEMKIKRPRNWKKWQSEAWKKDEE